MMEATKHARRRTRRACGSPKRSADLLRVGCACCCAASTVPIPVGGWRINGVTSDQEATWSVPRLPAPRWLRLPALRRSKGYRAACTEALPDERAVAEIGCLFRAQGLVRCARDRPLHPDRDRQRFLLPGQGLHARSLLIHLTPSTQQALPAARRAPSPTCCDGRHQTGSSQMTVGDGAGFWAGLVT